MTLTWTFKDSSSQAATAHYAPFAPKSRPLARGARDARHANSEMNSVGLTRPRNAVSLRVLQSGSVVAPPLMTGGNKAGNDLALLVVRVD
jgi:hypothetical protein